MKVFTAGPSGAHGHTGTVDEIIAEKGFTKDHYNWCIPGEIRSHIGKYIHIEAEIHP